MKYIRRYEDVQAFESDNSNETIAYHDIQDDRGLFKTESGYTGFANSFVGTLPFTISNLETLYLLNSMVDTGATEIATYEIEIGNTTEEIRVRRYGVTTAITATAATINGGPYPTGWVYNFGEEGHGYGIDYDFFFYNEEMDRIENWGRSGLVYVFEEEIEYDMEVKTAIVTIDKFQTESFVMNDQGKVLVTYEWGGPDPLLMNYLGPGLYYITGDQEHIGKYQEGTETKAGIVRWSSSSSRKEGHVVTSVENPSIQYLKVIVSPGHYYYYLITGMDAEDPTAYALDSWSYITHGFVYLKESKDMEGAEPFYKIDPGVAYEGTEVHYNSRNVDVKGEGEYTWEQLGITDALFEKWMNLYHTGNAMGRDYNFTFIGRLSMSRGSRDNNTITFYESYTTNGYSDLCDGYAAEVHRDSGTVWVYKLRCV